MACRTGCPDGTHTSWGECARAARFGIAYCNSAGGWDYSREKRFQSENDYYAQAISDGLEPATVNRASIDAAYAAAEGA